MALKDGQGLDERSTKERASQVTKAKCGGAPAVPRELRAAPL